MKSQNSTDRMEFIMREVFKELLNRDSRARGSDVLAAIAPRLDLTEHEKELTSTGAVRWDTHVRFHTSDCVRAGFLTKSNGYWTLTDDGRKALDLSFGELIRTARRRYNAWRKSQEIESENDLTEDEGESSEHSKLVSGAIYERAVEQAQEELENAILDLGPYEFQTFLQHLFEGMGYYVPFKASPGKDGGIDIIAYNDPLGATTPRIKCQIKHQKVKQTVKEVRELQGLLGRGGDVGILVSSSGFTSDAIRDARASHVHLELMDLERIIDLWDQHYEDISEEGKAMLPLARIAFLAPSE